MGGYHADKGTTDESAVYSEATRLRLADAAAADDRGRQDAWRPPTETAPVQLVQTTTVGTYPTSAQRYYAVKPVAALGTESEGSSGSLSVGSDVFYALNLGGSIPPSGTNVLATMTGHRWTFRYD